MLRVAVALVLALFLAGCTIQDVIDGARRACGYTPAYDGAAAVVLAFTGPGGAITVGVVKAAVTAICGAVKQAEGKKGARPVVVMKNYNGKIVRIPINKAD